MIICLRSHIHKSSRTRYTEHHNNHIITSSHIQIINLKVKVLPAWEQVPDRDLVVRMRAHFPAVRRRPHILLCGEQWSYLLTSAVLTYTLAFYCGLSFTLPYFYDCSENAAAQLGRNARLIAHPASLEHWPRCCKFFLFGWLLASCDIDSRILPLPWYLLFWSH